MAIQIVANRELGDSDSGGQNVPNARGGGTRLERKLGLLTPKLRVFCRISVEKGQIQGPPKIQNFHPPSNFGRFNPHLCRSPSEQRFETSKPEGFLRYFVQERNWCSFWPFCHWSRAKASYLLTQLPIHILPANRFINPTLIGISQKGSPEWCRFRFFSFFPFSSAFFLFFPFPLKKDHFCSFLFFFFLFFSGSDSFRFFPFFFCFSVFFLFSVFFRFIFRKKNREDTVRETLLRKTPSLVSNCSATPAKIAATTPEARQGFGGPNYPRHPTGGSGMGCDRACA